MRKRIGSSFDSFLLEEGIKDEVDLRASVDTQNRPVIDT